ncbi:phosphatase PAP2 family protein [bacterium]|nr:phosphatase PAP2 family protein [bacterium]
MSFKSRFLCALGFGIFSLLFYKICQYLAPHITQPVTLGLPFEEKIPFIPLFTIFYIGCYILPPWLMLNIHEKGRMIKVLSAFMVTSLIHFTIFTFYPVQYIYRPLIASENAHGVLFTLKWIYFLDEPINNFPSMHVSFSFLSYYFVRRYLPEHKWVVGTLVLLISLSTLFVKQHYIVDVLAAALLAWLVSLMFIEKTVKIPHPDELFPKKEGTSSETGKAEAMER